ncbi:MULTISPECIES: Na/Pi cotransporter family protein [Fusobacterium]|uniref:Na/Pi cotransporter family protein n=1 Tax=Fusobacterium TaxID=848 RepID=UPI001F351A5D|nr:MULTISPECIES: Na/Pi cotransporter family protein [Fusobacterium]MCF2611985.1 Na/Pi cotransporter family protein [Fusobacterium perfoetens]MDY2980022.1 Na/Pi cotransporter family protein [Fusobacterium sp.]
MLEILMKVVGGLGLFLYGMDNMSSGMQKIAGKRLKKVLTVITKNRFLAIGAGIFTTMLVQSSSVSTVMAIGFVNASLLTLNQALGLILGANIGTTVTGWLLALDMGKFGLPIAGVGAIAYMFSKNEKLKIKASTLLGLGLIFFGLQLMSDGLKPIRSMPEFIELFSLFTADSYFGALKAALVGALITSIVQSSAATLGITITLATQGLISYPTAVALVLGENVGTTITAFLASFGANSNAKRAAYAHTIINIVGVCWAISIFPFYLKFLNFVANPEVNINLAIATAHTMFNIINVILFIPFVNQLGRFLCKIVKDDGKEVIKVTKLDKLMVKTPSVVIGQSTQEVINMNTEIKGMLDILSAFFDDNNKNHLTADKLQELQVIEERMDLYQKEITDINYMILSTDMSDDMKDDTRKNIEICDEYETISDYGVRIGKVLNKFEESEIKLTENERTRLRKLNRDIVNLYELINVGYKNKDKTIFAIANEKANIILKEFRKGRETHLENVSKIGISVTQSIGYMDILNYYRRLRDHIVNIIELYLIEG